MAAHAVSARRVALARDFGLRFCSAVQEYEVASELGCAAIVVIEAEVAQVRLERSVGGRLDYVVKHVFYAELEDVSERAFKAMSLASELLAALLLKEGP